MIKEFEISREFEGLIGEQDSNITKASKNKITGECDKKAKACKATCKNFLRGKYHGQLHRCAHIYVHIHVHVHTHTEREAIGVLFWFRSSANF